VAEADEAAASCGSIADRSGHQHRCRPSREYGGDTAGQAAFNEFLHRLPFYGPAVLCIDVPSASCWKCHAT
jgi:hypothetical protein